MLTELPAMLYDVAIDATDWPIVILTTPEKVNDEKLEGFLTDFHDFIRQKKEHYCMIMDVSGTSGMTPKQRRIQNDAMSDKSTNQYIDCVAMVFKSKIMSQVLTAILWCKKTDYPVKVFSSVEDAKDWVKNQR